jgi:hypothetical protein
MPHRLFEDDGIHCNHAPSHLVFSGTPTSPLEERSGLLASCGHSGLAAGSRILLLERARAFIVHTACSLETSTKSVTPCAPTYFFGISVLLIPVGFHQSQQGKFDAAAICSKRRFPFSMGSIN